MKVTDKVIEKHRKKIPLPFEEITFYSSFVQLLGERPEDYAPEDRFKRFSRNLELLKENGEQELYDYWAKDSSNETCQGCIHRDINRNWCLATELPCNYNPILRGLGMACCGAGKEVNNQLELF